MEKSKIKKRTPKPSPITEKQFIEKYVALCKEAGWQISGQPALKPINDLGGSLVIVQLGVIPYVEKK
jgi:hypothetical protein